MRNVKQLFYIFTIFLAQFAYFGTAITFLKPLIPSLNIAAIALLSILVIAHLLKEKNQAKAILLYAVIIVVSVASYIFSKNATILYLALLGMLSYKRSFQQIVKTDFLVKIAVFAIVLICYFANATNGAILLRNGELRATLGFAHPNTLGYILAMIYADYLCIYTKNGFWKNLGFALATIFVASLADSRTAIFIIIILFLGKGISAWHKRKNETKKPKFIAWNKVKEMFAVSLPILLVVFSLGSTALYRTNNDFAHSLDTALSGRIHLQQYYEDNYNVSPLGQEMDFSDKALDNAYYKMLYNFGVIGVAAIVTTMCVAIKRSRRKSYSYILFIMSFYALSESVVLRTVTNPYWLTAFAEKEEEKDDK